MIFDIGDRVKFTNRLDPNLPPEEGWVESQAEESPGRVAVTVLVATGGRALYREEDLSPDPIAGGGLL